MQKNFTMKNQNTLISVTKIPTTNVVRRAEEKDKKNIKTFGFLKQMLYISIKIYLKYGRIIRK